jgi:hypothetical protein
MRSDDDDDDDDMFRNISTEKIKHVYNCLGQQLQENVLLDNKIAVKCSQTLQNIL